MKRILLIVVCGAVALSVGLGQEAAKKKAMKATAQGHEAASVEQQLKDLENEWNEATLKHDAAVLDRILASDVVDTGEAGVHNKAEDLADFKAGEPKLESSTVDNMKVRVYGNVAVVNGHYSQKGTYKGKDESGQGAFTDVFVKRQGRWQCISTQGTRFEKQ